MLTDVNLATLFFYHDIHLLDQLVGVLTDVGDTPAHAVDDDAVRQPWIPGLQEQRWLHRATIREALGILSPERKELAGP